RSDPCHFEEGLEEGLLLHVLEAVQRMAVLPHDQIGEHHHFTFKRRFESERVRRMDQIADTARLECYILRCHFFKHTFYILIHEVSSILPRRRRRPGSSRYRGLSSPCPAGHHLCPLCASDGQNGLLRDHA